MDSTLEIVILGAILSVVPVWLWMGYRKDKGSNQHVSHKQVNNQHVSHKQVNNEPKKESVGEGGVDNYSTEEFFSFNGEYVPRVAEFDYRVWAGDCKLPEQVLARKVGQNAQECLNLLRLSYPTLRLANVDASGGELICDLVNAPNKKLFLFQG